MLSGKFPIAATKPSNTTRHLCALEWNHISCVECLGLFKYIWLEEEFGDRFRQEVSELWSRLSGGIKSRVTTMFVVSTS